MKGTKIVNVPSGKTTGKKKKTSRSGSSAGRPSNGVKYHMRLFVAGDEPNSVTARRNIRDLCSEHLEGNFNREIIDVFEDFAAAVEENIMVSPALVIDKPNRAKVFGNLENKDRVLSALGLK